MSKFGWSYPPGAENDPYAPYNQTDEPYEFQTDPYGILEYAIGSGDDFWCFDYDIDRDGELIQLHAVINSETGCFIQNAEPPIVCPFTEAVENAQRLVDYAINWLYNGGDPIEHDTKGWNQDPRYFVRMVQYAVGGIKDLPPRIV